MHSLIIFICLLLAYNVNSQDCGIFPSNLPVPINNLLSIGSPVSLTNVLSPCGCIKPCGCPEPCVCGTLFPPTVPPCGCYNPAIGLQNPIIGVQSCGCTNAFGACTCGTPVVGNLCGRTTPTVGIATTCGCNDPPVRIIDGCPRCQPIYSYNLPSLGCPTCGYAAPSLLPCGCAAGVGCGCGSIAPYAPCGCGYPCGCNSCGCSGPFTCSPVNSCGCVEVPCGLPKVRTTCTCVTPTVETPCGCAQGKPTCACATTVEVPTCGLPVLPPFAPVIGCPRYLRQVCVQPPCL